MKFDLYPNISDLGISCEITNAKHKYETNAIYFHQLFMVK